VTWKSIDRYSKDYIELQTKDKVRFYKTPDAILQRQLDIFDKVEAEYSEKNPLFKEIAASQRKFAERTVKWKQDYVVSPRLAYNHYFAKRRQPPRSQPCQGGTEEKVMPLNATSISHPGSGRMADFWIGLLMNKFLFTVDRISTFVARPFPGSSSR